MILPKVRDPRFVTVRRGGSLQDDDHRLLAVWAADCAQHVLHHFEQARPGDDRPRRAIDLGRAWARGEVTMTQARSAAGHANAAARELSGAARHAAYAAGQAGAVAHVAAHELGAAAYAIKAARAASPEGERVDAGRLECQWQRAQLPERNPRARARRPAAAQRAVLVRLRLLSGRSPSGPRALGWLGCDCFESSDLASLHPWYLPRAACYRALMTRPMTAIRRRSVKPDYAHRSVRRRSPPPPACPLSVSTSSTTRHGAVAG